jgi:hypothetical protein
MTIPSWVHFSGGSKNAKGVKTNSLVDERTARAEDPECIALELPVVAEDNDESAD